MTAHYEPESERVTADVPNSPIAGKDEVPFQTGNEVRRARATVEVIYTCDEGQFVDIQALIFDAVVGLDAPHGEPLTAVDLTEHVVLCGRKAVAPVHREEGKADG